MKAIVVKQPWATLIALGIKTIETRPSPPNGPMRPDGVRGLPGCSLERGERIAIVAGAAHGIRRSTWRKPHEVQIGSYRVENDGGGIMLRGDSLSWPYRMPLGAVACTVTVADALPMEPCPPHSSSFDDRWEPEPPTVLYLGGLDGGPWAFIDGVGPLGMVDQLPLGDFTPGRWGWLLTDPEPCTPVPCKGRQGVFTLPADVVQAVPA